MKKNKLFRRALFGYKKKDVNAYLTGTIEGRLCEKDEQIAALESEIRNLNARIDSFQEKEEELVHERADIANAILDAEKQARAIIEQARADAMRECADARRETAAEAKRLREMQLEIGRIRRAATAAVNRLNAEIAPISADEA